MLCCLQLGPLRNVEGVAEIAGSMSAAGLVLILALCLSIYGGAMFQGKGPAVGVKTLSGRSVARDPLFSSEGCVACWALVQLREMQRGLYRQLAGSWQPDVAPAPGMSQRCPRPRDSSASWQAHCCRMPHTDG